MNREQATYVNQLIAEVARLADVAPDDVTTNAWTVGLGSQITVTLRLQDLQALLERCAEAPPA